MGRRDHRGPDGLLSAGRGEPPVPAGREVVAERTGDQGQRAYERSFHVEGHGTLPDQRPQDRPVDPDLG